MGLFENSVRIHSRVEAKIDRQNFTLNGAYKASGLMTRFCDRRDRFFDASSPEEATGCNGCSLPNYARIIILILLC